MLAKTISRSTKYAIQVKHYKSLNHSGRSNSLDTPISIPKLSSNGSIQRSRSFSSIPKPRFRSSKLRKVKSCPKMWGSL